MPDDLIKKRRSRRDNVLLSASLDLPDRSQPVKLRNLSEDGALVEGAGLVEPNCYLLFRRNEIEVPARVVWVRGGFVGIAFERPLERKVVLRHVPASVPRSDPPPPRLFKRPGLTTHQMSAEEKEWIDHWVGPSDPRKDGS
jgi:hypothetical protein